MPLADRTRCAIYTRKSTERGLDMAVNSLEAQRDVCQAYIKCQAHRKWVEVPRRYDDGGYSGGTLERPALRQLIADVEAGCVDVILIYKIDRLTRSLLDFVRLIEVLDRYGASFVSVTQAFDTSDSMGRLVLNVLLTFAQFERELMSDRVRDKKAAMQRKGLFTGGLPPFGYLIQKGGKLAVDPDRAELVREIFRRYPEVSSVRVLVDELRARGCVTRRYVSKNGRHHGGQPITTAVFRQILSNPIYTGHIVHRGEWIEAQIPPLITRHQWDNVQEERLKRTPNRNPNRNFLLGIVHDEHGRRMRIQNDGPGRTNSLRYYRSEYAGWSRRTEFKRILVRADRVEELAKSTLKAFLADRAQVKDAVLSLGLYSDEIGRLLKKGPVAARRVALMDQRQIRQLFLTLMPRAEVTKFGLRMYISCHELGRFLAWNGIGLFTRSRPKPNRNGDRVYRMDAPAFLICGHPRVALPISPRENTSRPPKPYLAELIWRAVELRDYVLSNRTKSISELAKEKRIGEGLFARLLRVNYLALDIQVAIIDGAQPEGLTQHDILYGPLALDWAQQRQLMGFPSPTL
jgi:site-specific DNA recombinase